MRKVFEKGSYRLYTEKDTTRILLNFSEMKKYTDKFLSRRLLTLHKDVAYKEMTNCSNAVK
jgi:hypothetical protein